MTTYVGDKVVEIGHLDENGSVVPVLDRDEADFFQDVPFSHFLVGAVEIGSIDESGVFVPKMYTKDKVGVSVVLCDVPEAQFTAGLTLVAFHHPPELFQGVAIGFTHFRFLLIAP